MPKFNYIALDRSGNETKGAIECGSQNEAIGRVKDARRLFARLLKMSNDLGLLSEEYDVERRRLVGNFPQAFSHVALVNSARRLSSA